MKKTLALIMAAALAGSTLQGAAAKRTTARRRPNRPAAKQITGELHRQRERQSSRPSVRQMHLLR